MSRRHLHRCLTAFCAAASLLFAQLALANYVCPGQTDTAAMAGMMATGQPCEGMDAAQPTLCHQHAADAAQSSEVAKLPAASLPVIVHVLQMPLAFDAGAGCALPVAATAEARPPPDPLFLATLRLRV
jgi:hypothetical protein